MALPAAGCTTAGDGWPAAANHTRRSSSRAPASSPDSYGRSPPTNHYEQLDQHARAWGGGRSLPEGEPSLQLCGTRPRATRDARPRQLPTDTSHAVPTRECQSDPPSLPRDARHPTPEPPTPTTRRTLTVGSMSVAQPPLTVRPALIARAPQPRVELVLHSPLDDQPSAQPRQLQQRLPGVLTHPYRQHVLDPSLDLRRRRYGTSHGVGPPSIVLSGLEGTYAVASTAPALFTALLRRDPTHRRCSASPPRREPGVQVRLRSLARRLVGVTPPRFQRQ